MGAPAGAVGLRVPSARTTALLHLLAIAILLAETIYWLAQPCTGDFIGSCAPVLGLVTGIVAAILALGLLVHVVADRSGLLVVADALILSATLRLVVPASVDLALLGFSLLTVVAAVGIAGAIANLLRRRVEPVVVVVLLALEALWLGVLALVPAVIAAVLVVILVRRGGPARSTA